MMKKNIFLLILLTPISFVAASSFSLDEQRKEFMLAEQFIKDGKDVLFFNKLDLLEDYPLYPYLQYQWLKNNLNQTVKISNYLKENRGTRYAGLLNYKWLFYLAKQRDWQTFIRYYGFKKNTKLQCLFFRAKYNIGSKKEAFIGAKKLWTVGKSQPKECDPVFKVLKKSPYFTRDMLWQRFDAALKNKKLKLAEYVKGLMNKKDRAIAKIWLKVHAKPDLIKDDDFLKQTYVQSGLIFAHGVDRLASTDYINAIHIWDSRKKYFNINEKTINRIEQRLAMSLAYHGEQMAYARLSQLEKPDEATQEWRVRTALRSQNWQQVEQSISVLSKATKEKDKWRYWSARALEKTNKPNIANHIYTELAKERSFFGYLSAHKLNKEYQLSDHPVQVSPKIFDRFKQKTDFRVVIELIKVDKKLEAKRQWWYAVNKLDKKELLMAAKFAQQLNWKQIAIFTIAKAQYWDDISLRFPLAYESHVQKNAKTQQLNPALVYALIRRESAFDQNAWSPAGARGLMQIMPKTGQQIARELKQKWRGIKNLLKPSINVKYGSYYYKKLLNQFGGHYALAAAGYNAGPHRVKRWLPEQDAMAADIWIESIPFNETRAYVSAVLTYALIYQKQLGINILTMKDFMRDVLPGYVQN